LDDCIADALYVISAQDLPAACAAFGLAPGDGAESFKSKLRYVKCRIISKSQQELIDLGQRVQEKYPSFRLQEALWKLAPPTPAISDLTRRKLLDALSKLADLTGDLSIHELFGQLWPLDQLRLPNGESTITEGIWQHMVRNPEDWGWSNLFDVLEVMHVSQQRFWQLLELLVHPTVRHDKEQDGLVAIINSHIQRDGLHLAPSDVLSGFQVYALTPISGGVSGQAKNLIFAADGPKPEIVLSDAINNDIQIVENAEFCLVYSRAIPPGGLRWKELVNWWAEQNGLPDNTDTARLLYGRLARSLASEPEKLLFRTYFKYFRESLGDSLPALVPQVYLHYDPYTVRQLGRQRLPRQRMDFLLLLSHSQRIVLEVDGQQHYSENGTPSPMRYSEMVKADRELRLAGYEVYRFGGYELNGDVGEKAMTAFFEKLFAKYAVGPASPTKGPNGRPV
jgi:hypothetical protein